MLNLGPLQLTYGAAGSWALVVLVIVALIKAWPALTKLRSESDVSLRRDLMKRVSELEGHLTESNERCRQEQAALQKQIDGKDQAIIGLQRQFIALQITLARRGIALPLGQVSPEIEKMVDDLMPHLFGVEGLVAAVAEKAAAKPEGETDAGR